MEKLLSFGPVLRWENGARRMLLYRCGRPADCEDEIVVYQRLGGIAALGEVALEARPYNVCIGHSWLLHSLGVCLCVLTASARQPYWVHASLFRRSNDSRPATRRSTRSCTCLTGGATTGHLQLGLGEWFAQFTSSPSSRCPICSQGTVRLYPGFSHITESYLVGRARNGCLHWCGVGADVPGLRPAYSDAVLAAREGGLGWQLVAFGLIGLVSTVATVVLYALVRAWSPSLVAEHHAPPSLMDEGITPALACGAGIDWVLSLLAGRRSRWSSMSRWRSGIDPA
jgi:hypothetical protein